MCNCISEKEKGLAEKFGYKSVSIDQDIISQRVVVGFGGVDAKDKVFDGMKMIVSYCPFCGEKYNTQILTKDRCVL